MTQVNANPTNETDNQTEVEVTLEAIALLIEQRMSSLLDDDERLEALAHLRLADAFARAAYLLDGLEWMTSERQAWLELATGGRR